MYASVSAFGHNTVYLQQFSFGTVATLMVGRYNPDLLVNHPVDYRADVATWQEQRLVRDAAANKFYSEATGMTDVTFSGLTVEDVITLLKDASPEVWVERRATRLFPYSPTQFTNVEGPFNRTTNGFSVPGFTFYVYGAVHVIVEAAR